MREHRDEWFRAHCDVYRESAVARGANGDVGRPHGGEDVETGFEEDGDAMDLD